jgi:hypothetical protein
VPWRDVVGQEPERATDPPFAVVKLRLAATLAVGLLISLLGSACGAKPVSLSPQSPAPASAARLGAPPSPFAAPPALSAVNFSCRLPIASSDAPFDGKQADGRKGTGGFITFPNATFQTDLASLGSYDPAARKWLPVPFSWISPDGSAYAYTDGATGYVTDAGSGTRKSFGLPYPAMVVAYDTSGVYVEHVIPFSDANPRGIGLLDPSSGAYAQLFPPGTADEQQWFSVERGGIGYVLQLNQFWGNPPVDGARPIGNELYRVDLNQSAPPFVFGGLVSVMSIADAAIMLVGFDGGDQPVLSARSTSYYRIYTAASIQIGGTPSMPSGPPEYEGPPTADWNPTGPALGDTHGIWFTSKSGSIWLYVPGKGMKRVAQLPMQSPIIAGPCA